MHNRIVHLLFFCLLLMAGLFMAGGSVPNPYFGVRTTYTLADPEQWRAINSVAGMQMMLIGWLGFFLLSLQQHVGPWRLIALISASTVLLIVPPALPALTSKLYTWLAAHGLGDAVSAGPLLAPLATLLLLGGLGNLLYLEAVPRNRYLGFRLRAAMQNTDNWQKANQAGGRLLHWLSGGGVLATCIAASAGHSRAAFLCSLAVLMLSPLVAYAAAVHSLREQGN